MAAPDPAEKVTALNARFSSVVESLRQNRQLTDDAKRRAIAKAWLATNDEVVKLKEQVLGESERHRRDLEERLLRPKKPHVAASASERTAAVSLWRDALDRADRADTPEGLLRLLKRAQNVDDQIQVRAVLATAFERGPAAYVEVLNAHAALHPDEETGLQELVNYGPMSTAQRLRVEMAMPAPPVPGELGNNPGEWAIRRLADGAGPVTADVGGTPTGVGS